MLLLQQLATWSVLPCSSLFDRIAWKLSITSEWSTTIILSVWCTWKNSPTAAKDASLADRPWLRTGLTTFFSRQSNVSGIFALFCRDVSLADECMFMCDPEPVINSCNEVVPFLCQWRKFVGTYFDTSIHQIVDAHGKRSIRISLLKLSHLLDILQEDLLTVDLFFSRSILLLIFHFEIIPRQGRTEAELNKGKNNDNRLEPTIDAFSPEEKSVVPHFPEHYFSYLFESTENIY